MHIPTSRAFPCSHIHGKLSEHIFRARHSRSWATSMYPHGVPGLGRPRTKHKGSPGMICWYVLGRKAGWTDIRSWGRELSQGGAGESCSEEVGKEEKPGCGEKQVTADLGQRSWQEQQDRGPGIYMACVGTAGRLMRLEERKQRRDGRRSDPGHWRRGWVATCWRTFGATVGSLGFLHVMGVLGRFCAEWHDPMSISEDTTTLGWEWSTVGKDRSREAGQEGAAGASLGLEQPGSWESVGTGHLLLSW